MHELPPGFDELTKIRCPQCNSGNELMVEKVLRRKYGCMPSDNKWSLTPYVDYHANCYFTCVHCSFLLSFNMAISSSIEHIAKHCSITEKRAEVLKCVAKELITSRLFAGETECQNTKKE